jgi:hypothetical protein
MECQFFHEVKKPFLNGMSSLSRDIPRRNDVPITGHSSMECRRPYHGTFLDGRRITDY